MACAVMLSTLPTYCYEQKSLTVPSKLFLNVFLLKVAALESGPIDMIVHGIGIWFGAW